MLPCASAELRLRTVESKDRIALPSYEIRCGEQEPAAPDALATEPDVPLALHRGTVAPSLNSFQTNHKRK